MKLPQAQRTLYHRLRVRIADAVFDSRLVARLARREHVICLGDSHVQVMRHVHVPGFWFRPEPLEGATASGILNPNSKTHAFSTFTERLVRAKPWQHVLLQLGEVDCGFVIWHRAQRHGLSVDEQLQTTLENYEKFIGHIRALGLRSMMVLSAPLPTITDYPSDWGEVANLRKEITATQQERTDLTIRFNDGVARICARLGVRFVDATTDQLDAETGLIAREFVRASTLDHHLADEPYAALIATRIVRPHIRLADAVEAGIALTDRLVREGGGSNVRIVMGIDCQGLTDDAAFGCRGYSDPYAMRNSLEKHARTVTSAVTAATEQATRLN